MKVTSSSTTQGITTDRDYRFLAFAIVSAYIALMLFSEFYFGTYCRILKYFVGCPVPYFIDTQVLLTGIDAVRQGLDPYSKEANVNLLLGFYNYPLTWTWLSFLPFLTVPNTIALGLAQLLLFFIALYFFIGKINLFESIAYGVIFTSSAVMLCVERGNSDLIIFLLLLLPIFRPGAQITLALTALASGFLKLIPITALLGLAYHIRHNRRQCVLLLCGSVFVFLAFVAVMWDNLISVSRVTPRPFESLCYGLGTLPSYLQKLSGAQSHQIWAPYLMLLSAGFIVFHVTARKKISMLTFHSDKFGLAHIIGSSIFVASCLIGYNWEYRLVFLILTMPQTLKWVQAKNIYPSIALALTVLVMEQTFIVAQIEPRLPLQINYFLISQLFAVLLFLYHSSILLHFIMQRISELRSGPEPGIRQR